MKTGRRSKLADGDLERVKRLVAQTDLSVAAICDELGYTSRSGFGRWFKVHVGVSPLEYRRAVQLAEGVE